MSGKTTLACKLAVYLEHCCLSTDDVGTAIRAVSTPLTHPGLHVMQGEDYRDYYVNRSLDELLADAERQHEAVWPAVEQIIRAHATWGAPAIIEGWDLQPQRVAQLNLPGIQSLWLAVDEADVERRVRRDTDFLKGAADVEKLIRHFVDRSIKADRQIRHGARVLKMPILELAGGISIDESVRGAMAVLSASADGH
jgi:2-phosphoglycerate kinase